MNSTDDWRTKKFDAIFDEIFRSLSSRRKLDQNFKMEDIERTLESLYIRDGADLEGPGTVQSILSAATIAAHEQYLAEWKAERSD